MRLRSVFLVASAIATLSLAPAHAHPADEVSPEEDNPPGCVTATGEDTPQCGAQGRQHFDDPAYRPPIEACADRVTENGSRITRVLPDGPRLADGTMAFIPGVCVYLPPGYGTGGLRYPTVYLLHGGGGDQSDWVNLGQVQQTFDAAYAADPANAAIAVMPDGRSGMWFDSYDGTMRIETYVLEHVVPYIDRHFRTIDDRRGRAIAGLSNGGYGAMHLAAKRPDLFAAVGAMSANIGARAMGGLGTPIAEGGPSFQEAGATYYGSVPIELVPNLGTLDVTMDLGASCSSDLTVDLCATFAFDQLFLADNRAFRDRMASEGHPGTFEYRETEGGHAWRWWSMWLRERHLPFFLARLADPTHAPVRTPLPESFDHRSIKPAFTVFGYDVAVDRPAREFLDLRDVTAGGFTVTGSGLVTITTAPRYEPGATYVVDGAPTVADAAGRLHIVVDLGPGHADEQYSPRGRVMEATPGYWTERTITIEA